MPTKKIKLIVCDMDGTLLKNDKTVSKENRERIEWARAQGTQFSVCTGRIQPMTEYYLKDLALTTPVITANGALIWDPAEQRTLWEKPMDAGEMMELLHFCKRRKLDYCALTMGASFFSPENKRIERFRQYNAMAVKRGLTPMRLEAFDQQFACVKHTPVHKVLILETGQGQLEETKDFLTNLAQTGYTASEDGILDISHSSVNKGKGLLKLCQLLDIAPERVCAMGDYENDIPMLEAAGYSVAMGNGCRAVRERADFVTKTNEESGVACAISHFLR